MPNTETPGVLLYGRQSAGKERSIREQLEDGQSRADVERWAIRNVYRDEISASRYAKKDRDEWPKLLAELKSADVDILWLWESSRGDRKASAWLAMLETCIESHVKIYIETARRLLDPSDDYDWEQLARMGVDSQSESNRFSYRVLRGLGRNQANGTPHATPPYGYRHLFNEGNGKFQARVVDDEQAEHVRELFDRIASGWTLSAIQRDWASRGILAPRREILDQKTGEVRRVIGGGPFPLVTLQHMALNPAYAGMRVHLTKEQRRKTPHLVEGVSVKADWDAIIDVSIWWDVRRRLLDPKRLTHTGTSAKHLLTHSTAAVCGVCGGQLRARVQTGAWLYICRANHVRADMRELDTIAEQAIIAYLSRADHYNELAGDSADTSGELAGVGDDLARLRSEQAELAEALSTGKISVALAVAGEQGLTGRIEALETRRGELMTPSALRGLIRPGDDVAARWAIAPIPARRMIARIVLAPEAAGQLVIGQGVAGVRTPVAGRVSFRRADGA